MVEREILVHSKECTSENTASLAYVIVHYSYYCDSTVNAAGLPTCTYTSCSSKHDYRNNEFKTSQMHQL